MLDSGAMEQTCSLLARGDSTEIEFDRGVSLLEDFHLVRIVIVFTDYGLCDDSWFNEPPQLSSTSDKDTLFELNQRIQGFTLPTAAFSILSNGGAINFLFTEEL